jgi:exodeoxyribonuclease-3
VLVRISTWNVNGIRACWDKGLARYLQTVAPEVMGVQEVKGQREGLPAGIGSPPGYRTLWHCAARPGYSGVGMFVKEEWAARVLWHVMGVGIPTVDEEGRVMTLELPDFFYVNAYFPNSGEGGRRIGYKLEFCAWMETFLTNLRRRGKPVLLAGDLNIAPHPIDVHSTMSAAGQAGYLPPERLWLRRFLEGPWVDVFRRDRPEETGHFTWWSFYEGERDLNMGWRIDTFIASEDLAPRVRCEIHSQVMGSDHCPVMATIL